MKNTNKILTILASCASLTAYADTGSTSVPAPGTGASSSGMSSSGSTSASDSNAAGSMNSTGDTTSTGDTQAPAGGTANAPSTTGTTRPDSPNMTGSAEMGANSDVTGTGVSGMASGTSASRNSRQNVMDAQRALVNQGFSISVDGRNGPQTHNAVRQFQARQGLPETGMLDDATREALRTGGSAAQPSASDTSAE